MSATATLAAVTLMVDGLTAVTQLSTKLQAASATLQKAHVEGREVTDQELDEIRASLKAARDRLASLVV